MWASEVNSNPLWVSEFLSEAQRLQESLQGWLGASEVCEEPPRLCSSKKIPPPKNSHFKLHIQDQLQTHSGERPFSCTQCEFSCTQAGNLKQHMPTHTGEKPFACKQCSFSCSHYNGLKYHMLSHTGEKPFSCKQCNYFCKQFNDLKKQMRKHSAKTNT